MNRNSKNKNKTILQINRLIKLYFKTMIKKVQQPMQIKMMKMLQLIKIKIKEKREKIHQDLKNKSIKFYN